jgi:hypothetical protein
VQHRAESGLSPLAYAASLMQGRLMAQVVQLRDPLPGLVVIGRLARSFVLRRLLRGRLSAPDAAPAAPASHGAPAAKAARAPAGGTAGLPVGAAAARPTDAGPHQPDTNSNPPGPLAQPAGLAAGLTTPATAALDAALDAALEAAIAADFDPARGGGGALTGTRCR